MYFPKMVRFYAHARASTPPAVIFDIACTFILFLLILLISLIVAAFLHHINLHTLIIDSRISYGCCINTTLLQASNANTVPNSGRFGSWIGDSSSTNDMWRGVVWYACPGVRRRGNIIFNGCRAAEIAYTVYAIAPSRAAKRDRGGLRACYWRDGLRAIGEITVSTLR